MDKGSLVTLAAKQQQFFSSGATLAVSYRQQQLRKLRASIRLHEPALLAALKADLNKPEFEAYSSELGIIYNELATAIRNVRSWAQLKKVKSPISLFYSTSYIYKAPVGTVLIIAPWNYPILLLLSPLIGAIAAGNCVVLKPSELTPNVANVLDVIIATTFDENYIKLIQGDGAVVVPQLLATQSFNHVFFTGSAAVGKQVARLCINKLIPYTLELGGKCPAIIDASANLAISCKRLAWAKFFNAGQTCIAPDYVLVDRKLQDRFLPTLINSLKQLYPPTTTNNKHNCFAKIVNAKNFARLLAYLQEEQQNIVYGGGYDHNTLNIEATLIELQSMAGTIMHDEIFGPLLPILYYDNISDLYSIIGKNPNPLALYVFSKNKNFINEIITRIPFGGGCINTSLFHMLNHHLPFGGPMQSGNGHYHGHFSFELFTHQKSIVDTATLIDINIKYPPYRRWKTWLMKKLFAR